LSEALLVDNKRVTKLGEATDVQRCLRLEEPVNASGRKVHARQSQDVDIDPVVGPYSGDDQTPVSDHVRDLLKYGGNVEGLLLPPRASGQRRDEVGIVLLDGAKQPDYRQRGRTSGRGDRWRPPGRVDGADTSG
jgi:hypothetical protein